MANLLRLILCGLVVASPWLLGAQTPGSQVFLVWPLIAVAVLTLVWRLLSASNKPARFPVLLLPLVALLAIGIFQLLPVGAASPFGSIHSLGLDELQIFPLKIPEIAALPQGVHTLSGPATRVCLSQFALVILGFWLAFELFDDPKHRRWLMAAITVNGVAMTAFGVAQRLTWNGKLFWTFPMRYGGSPFGPFSSRNNAAAYLLVCFACAMAGLIAVMFPFGMGKSEGPKPSFGNKFQGLIYRVLGNITPSILLSLTGVIVVSVGVMVSMSRAGQLGLVICMLVLLPALKRWSTHLLVLTVIVASAIYGGVLWLGQTQSVTKRFDSLANPLEAMQGRFDHWKEVEGLIRDFPLTGCGWGCYRWANPLYLSKDPNVWFYHAENQYLEVLVEAGILGLIGFVGAIILAAFASARAIRSDWDGTLLPTGLCGMLVVTAIATNSLTNFALSMGSIALTVAVLLGAVLSAFTRSSEVSPWIQWEVPAGWGRGLKFLMGSFLVATGGLAAFQIYQCGTPEWDVERVPRSASIPSQEMAEIDELLGRLDRWSERFPQNADVWAAIGELRVFRMRRALYDESVSLPESKKLGPGLVWINTRLERLDALATYSRSIGDFATEQRLLSLPAITENSNLAMKAYDRAVALQPLNRRAAVDRAWLKQLLNANGQSEARDLALLSCVSQADSLFQLGQISQRMEQTESQTRCWQRCLLVSSEWAVRIWDEMTLTEPESEVFKLFPDHLESLQAVMSLPFDKRVRQQILDRCEAIVAGDPNVPIVLIARLHAEEGKLKAAVEDYLRAIQDAPRDVDLRLEASQVLEKSGDIAKARSVVATANLLAPHSPKVKQRLEQLLTRERELK